MQYSNIPATTNEYFVLFHGTGGNEYSLLTVTGDINPHASVISFLGEEGTGAERRFFKPLLDGQLQRDDLDRKVDQFIEQWVSVKPIDAEAITFIGYSNGANFLLGVLEKLPDLADNVILLHPSNLGYTFEKGSDVRVFITTGANDTLSVPGDVMKLSKQLEEVFPHTTLKFLDSGHNVTPEEAQFVADYLKK